MTTPFPPGRLGGVGLAVAFCALVLGVPALGQQADDVIELDPILLTLEADAADLGLAQPGRTSFGRDLLQGEFSGAALSTVLDTIAGVSAESAAGDPGIAVNIRGLQNDGRVAVTIDGAPQNYARSDHSANNTFYADSEMLRSVEVLRGPVGTGAAAGAIGGTVAMRTVEARDLIADDALQGGEARLRYGSLTETPTLHAAWATRLGTASDLLFAVTTRQQADYTAPDGTEVLAATEELSFLAKYGHELAPGQRLTFGLSGLGSDYDTGQQGVPRRNRLDTLSGTLNFSGSLGAWDQIETTLYRTDTRVAQRLLDADRKPTGPERSYETLTTGLRAMAGRDFALGTQDHRLTVVLEGYEDRVRVDDPAAVIGSLTAPGTRSLWSLLAEDNVQFGQHSEAAFGLRYDTYRLGSDSGATEGQQVSPSLTLRQHLGPITLHAIVGRAFRPPTLSEALVNGMHPEPANFLIRPNPDLSPESATTFEIGATSAVSDVMSEGDRLDARLAVYRNEVDDYIGLVQKGTLFNSYFQYENIDRVRLEGVELELGYDSARWFGRVSGQSTRGIDRSTGAPVSGIAPDRLTLTAGWHGGDRGVEFGTRLTVAGGRDDSTLSSDPWQTVDLFLNRQIGPNGVFNLALNNITDETYLTYLATQPEPGFNAQASVTWKF